MTVRSVMPSRRAICLLARPSRTSASTSRSRGVRSRHVGRRPAGAEQLAGRPRVDRRLAAGHGADAVEDVVGLGVLEQVADRAGVERAHDPLGVGVRRQHQHVGQLLGDDRAGGADAVDARHLQVHQHDVGPGPRAPPRAPPRRRRPCRRRSRSATPASSWVEPAPHHRVVVDHHDGDPLVASLALDSTSIRTSVPVAGRATGRRAGRPRPSPGWQPPQPEARRVALGLRVEALTPSSTTRSTSRSSPPVHVDLERAWRARAGWRCGRPPGPPARPAATVSSGTWPMSSTRAPCVSIRAAAAGAVRSVRAAGEPVGVQVGRVDRHQQRPQRPSGCVRSDVRRRCCEVVAYARRARRSSRPTAVSENAVPARSWTTPSWRSRAIRRRSASEAVIEARSSRSRSRRAAGEPPGEHPDDRRGDAPASRAAPPTRDPLERREHRALPRGSRSSAE